MKRALITGASSGIGRSMAGILSRQGYELVLVARSRESLENLQRELPAPSAVIALDLSEPDACRELHALVQGQELDLLVNNAGFGVFGEFAATDLAAELELIDLNIKAVHILSKLFLADFIRNGRGTILNVASTAAFLPGPLLAAYYASKAYVLRLSEAIAEELRQKQSPVSISVLCPGPVKTAFNERAGAGEGLQGLDSDFVAAYALKMAARKKLVIIPGAVNKIARFAQRFLSEKMLLRMNYNIQKLKLKT